MDVALSDVTLRFGKVLALDNVDFRATSGGIHALVGENGAGKTTLMRVLFGSLVPDAGLISLDGQPRRFKRSAEAIAAGVGMVFQHYSVIGGLTCLQNLILGAEPGWSISPRSVEERAQRLADQMGYAFEWESLAEDLSPAATQKLEILKLLWRDAKVMILDEPTAMLSPADSDSLYASLKSIASKGATVVVVTHRLPEVFAHCQTVTVLRQGRLVAAKPVLETNPHDLAELMVGEQVEVHGPAPLIGHERFRVQGLSVAHAVQSADFHINRGEILGIAGVDGNGQRELFHTILGTQKPTHGSLSFDGIDWSDLGTAQRIAIGLRLIPEDRHAEGVIDEWSLEENAALGLQRLPPFAHGRWIDKKGRREAATQIADRFETKHPGLSHPIRSLSGGNQQRFVAARALEFSPSLILGFQPARGLDIKGTAEVFGALKEECRQGACALVVSFDLDELIDNCDRVIVMSQGRILVPPMDQAKDRQAIGRLMVGAA